MTGGRGGGFGTGRRGGRRDRRRPRPDGPFGFVAPDRVGGRPHLMVDGAPRQGTVATLSHWPGTPTPAALVADLSAESAALALRHRGALPRGVGTVTVDHADEDGAVAVALLCTGGLAAAHGELLVEAARVGDFGVVRDRRAALVAFALGALLDPRRTPVDEVRSGAATGLAATGMLVAAAVGRMAVLADDPDAARGLWAAEAAAYDASVGALGRGELRIAEEPERDLAVVEAPSGRWPPGVAWGGRPVHPAAVHSATTCMRVAAAVPGDCQAWFRYETWVRLARPPGRLRVDLHQVAADLDRREAGGHGPGVAASPRWRFDGAGALVPALRRSGPGPSQLGADEFLQVLREGLDRLDRGAPAWDPYR